MTNLVQIKLPEDRVQQLRNLAEAQGTSLSGAVGSLMKLLYEHTDVRHDIPSVKIKALSDGITIRCPDSEVTRFSFEAIGELANKIREYVDGQHAGVVSGHLTDRATHGGSFKIWRRGNSIKIAIPMDAPGKNFTRDLAEEFAALLERQVARS